MPRYEVFVPAAPPAIPRDESLEIEGDNWLGALRLGLARLGGARTPANVLCDVKPDGSIHVTDAATGRVLRIREAVSAAVRKAMEDAPDLFDGGVDWEGTFIDPGGPNLLIDLPPAIDQVVMQAGQPNQQEYGGEVYIRYSLPKSSDVSIDIFDITGRKMETLQSGFQPAGEHSIVWNTVNKPSGIYFYRLRAGETTQTQKCILMR